MEDKHKNEDQIFIEKIINEQFKIAGYDHLTFDYIIEEEKRNEGKEDEIPWYEKYITTEEKEKEFIKFLKKELKKKFKLTNRDLNIQVGMFLLSYGLKVDYE